MSIPGAGSPLFLSAAAADAAAYQVDRSVRVHSNDTANLSRTPSSASNRKTWTWSAWVKRSAVNLEANLFTVGSSSTDAAFRFNANDTLQVRDGGGGELQTNAVFRDPGAWSHIVVSLDNTQSTNTDRFKLYVNGVEQTYSSASYASQNTDGDFNTTDPHYIGRQAHNTSHTFDGYLAEIHFVDGTQLAASDFGEYDSNNVWQPKDCKDNLTYGTNGFYLKFADNSSDAALGTDSSGNSNTWTVNNITANASALQSQTWSSNFTTTGNSGNWSTNSSFAVTNAFNGNDSNYAHGNADGSVAVAVTLSISPAIPCNSTVTFLGGVTSSGTGTIAINGGTATAFSTVGTNPTAANTATVSFNGDITSIVVTKTSTSANGLLIYGFEVDGVRLVDSGVAYAAAAGTDSVIDTPTNYSASSGNNAGNYCTLNPLDRQSNNGELRNGNLDIKQTSAAWAMYRSTMFVSSGKYYWEVLIGNNQYTTIGICASSYFMSEATNAWANHDTDMFGYYPYDGNVYNGGNTISYATADTSASGDVIGVALDMDNGTLTFYKNGSSLGQAASGLTGKSWSPTHWLYNQTGIDSYTFGQRPFAYTPPAGFKSLCTTNFDDPTIADGSTAFDIALYTGNTTARSITGLNLAGAPDLVWIKRRDVGAAHVWTDSVRGTNKQIWSDRSDAEQTSTTAITSFNSDGWSLGTQIVGIGSTNSNGGSYVGFAWDGGTSTSSNSDGSITTNVRANTSAGFSIIGYTGNATVGATLGHGLNSAPEWLVFKNREEGAGNWYVYHKSAGHTKYLTLDRTHAATTHAFLNNTAPTNSIITLNNTAEVNATGQGIICYAWTSVAGYSAFGSYTGNGNSSSGPFVYTGFRPRWILIKSATEATRWYVWDTVRDTYNRAQNRLSPNETTAESTTEFADILSNGFKLRIDYGGVNDTNQTYVYCAFAEHPYKTSRAR